MVGVVLRDVEVFGTVACLKWGKGKVIESEKVKEFRDLGVCRIFIRYIEVIKILEKDNCRKIMSWKLKI